MFTARALLIALILGCGTLVIAAPPETPAEGKVTGLATLRGQPVSKARFFLHYPDGQFLGAKINEEGRFTISHAPVGAYKVTIEGPDIPAKYSSDEKSGLVVEVREGENTFQFDLH